MDKFIYIFLQFIVYSFIGYSAEVIYCSIRQKRLVNRGFLFGPICPIYGIGAVLVLQGLTEFKSNPIIIFFLSMLITSTLEYFTSYIFEKIFNNKWWDYSYRPDNINGRICLSNSIYFGLGSVITIYFVDPIVNNLIVVLSSSIVIIIVIMIIFIIDLIWSTIIAYNLKSRLIIAEELKIAKLKMIPKIFEKKYHDQLAKIKFKTNRLISNYPNLAKNLRKEINITMKMIVDAKNVKKKKTKSE